MINTSNEIIRLRRVRIEQDSKGMNYPEVYEISAHNDRNIYSRKYRDGSDPGQWEPHMQTWIEPPQPLIYAEKFLKDVEGLKAQLLRRFNTFRIVNVE